MEVDLLLELEHFLEDEKLIKLPKKKAKRKYALLYILSKFESEKTYTEKEVNEIIKSWHTFNDHAIIRRALCDASYLCREDDGSTYYKNSIINDEMKYE